MSETFNDNKVVMTKVIETEKDIQKIGADDNTEHEEVDIKFKERMAADIKFRRSFMYKVYRYLWYSPIAFTLKYIRMVSTYCSNKIERLLLPW
jgi:hypothetical protein